MRGACAAAEGQALERLAMGAKLAADGIVTPHVQKTYSLDAAGEALAVVEAGHIVGKIVLVVVSPE
jgi:NADPH:quinone reductase-like Zn-dependent oxidoreductase